MSSVTSLSGRNHEVSSEDTSGDDKAAAEPALKRRPGVEGDQASNSAVTDEGENTGTDVCDCGCECRLSLSIGPPRICMICMTCSAYLCSNCAHDGSKGGTLCHCCRDNLVDIQQTMSWDRIGDLWM